MIKAMPQERNQMGKKRSLKPILRDTNVKDITKVVTALIIKANTILCFNFLVFFIGQSIPALLLYALMN